MLKDYRYYSFALAIIFAIAWPWHVYAEGILDGQVFSGMIGPSENPDLPDRLYFDDGYFWSDLCTGCGFAPGEYEAEKSAGGTRFKGTLYSKSRGRFDYEGLVRDDQTIEVSITWERRRWYWTSKREIVFVGQASSSSEVVNLSDTRRAMQLNDPNANPMCARF